MFKKHLLFVTIFRNKKYNIYYGIIFSNELRYIKVFWFLKMDKNKCPKMKTQKKF